jgi:hypothetical protein
MKHIKDLVCVKMEITMPKMELEEDYLAQITQLLHVTGSGVVNQQFGKCSARIGNGIG